MKPDVFLVTICLCMAFMGCREPQIRPNVLFIAVDDLRTELGVYGSLAQTPHMDALARSGSYFTHHYVQAPTCGASRHALLTGIRPWKPIHLSNRAIELEISDKMETDTPETFIHHLKRNGYYTMGIGKISHSADGYVYGYEDPISRKKELPHSWNALLFDAGKWKTGWNAFFGYANGENRQSLKKQVRPYEAGTVDDTGYVDGLTTQLALEQLRELKGNSQPFFLGVGFFKPHLPFNAPKKYWDLYQRDDISLSRNPGIPENIHLQSLHGSGEFNSYQAGDEPAGLEKPVSDAYAQKLRHAYLASVSYIDAQIGKLWKELKALGLDKNTIIVIWGDHGWHLGDQSVWGKHTLFENALKSTLIIRSPYLRHHSVQVDQIVETVDIYPTLLELCDMDLPHSIDGQSMVQAMESKTEPIDDVAYSYFKKGISMRTKDYRITRYFREEKPSLELYDHSKDSLETLNIAQDRPQVIAHLLPLLEEGNTGLYNH